MKYNKSILSYLIIALINSFVLGICIIGSYSEEMKSIVYFITIVSYYIFLITRKNEEEIVIYQLLMYIESTFLLDSLFHFLKVQTPMELLYIVEGISIILLIRILLKKKVYNNIFSDPFMIVMLFVFLGGIINSIINKSQLIDVINGFRIYFRFIPIYIVLSKRKIVFNKLFLILYISNVLFFSLETYAGVFQDLRSGIFGIVGGSAFQIFSVVYLIYSIIRFLDKKIKAHTLLFSIIITVLMFAVAEHKAYLIITTGTCIVVLFLLNGKYARKILISISLFILLVVGMNVMVKLYPNFKYLLQIDKITYNIENYIFGNSNKKSYSMGRFEATKYIIDIEQDNQFKKLFGVGFGSSIPGENLFYVNDIYGVSKIIEFPKSYIFNKYGERIGYHLSTFSSIIIDSGIVGVLISILILIIIFLKGNYLLKNGSTTEMKTLGAMGIVISLAAIYSCGYSSALRSRGYMILVMTILGLLEHYVNETKKSKSERLQQTIE